MEIYNEIVNDLLSDPKSRPIGGLKVKAGEGGVVFVDGVEAQVSATMSIRIRIYLLWHLEILGADPVKKPPCTIYSWKLLSGGEHEGGDLRLDEEGGGEQAHGQDQDERAQQPLPHHI